jgi:quercetin dioxygenase-like cupin family protein
VIFKGTDAKTIFQQSDAIGKMLGSNAGCDFVKLDIKPGGVIETHSLDVKVTFFIVSGSGELAQNDKVEQASTSDLVTVQAGVMREWKNVGTDDLVVLVIKHMEYVTG